jgi:site-specific DNA-methyltransferase (adenine-specific)
MKLLHGDCLELMKDIPDGSVDCVITDPPYSRNTVTAHSRNGVRNLSDLSIQEFFYRNMFQEFARVLKKSGIVFSFCDDLFYPILFASSYHCLQGHSLITWDKENISFGRPIRKRHELIMYCSVESGGEFYPSEERTHFPSVISHKREMDKEHDAQKPLSVIEDLIKHFTKPNDIILDPFMGSGSTIIAANNLGRESIGIEMNFDYFTLAKQRIETAQQPLFV